MTFHQHKLSLFELLTVHASVYLEPRASLQDQNKYRKHVYTENIFTIKMATISSIQHIECRQQRFSCSCYSKITPSHCVGS